MREISGEKPSLAEGHQLTVWQYVRLPAMKQFPPRRSIERPRLFDINEVVI